MSVGVQWLVSLWAGTNEGDEGLAKTPEADKFTGELKMTIDATLDHDALLQLLAPDRFLQLDAFARQTVLSAIGPNPDQDLKDAANRAIAALAAKPGTLGAIYLNR